MLNIGMFSAHLVFSRLDVGVGVGVCGVVGIVELG